MSASKRSRSASSSAASQAAAAAPGRTASASATPAAAGSTRQHPLVVTDATGEPNELAAAAAAIALRVATTVSQADRDRAAESLASEATPERRAKRGGRVRETADERLDRLHPEVRGGGFLS